MSTKAASCPVSVYCQLLGGGVSLVFEGLQAQPVYPPYLQLGLLCELSCAPFPWPLLCGAILSLPPSPGPFCVGLSCPYPLHHWICFSRSLEQEISFDFGPHGEFSYLYSQYSELTTKEYILALVGGWVGRYRGGGHWANKSYSTYLRSHHRGTEANVVMDR